ncbi:hypothetical protein M077_2823 [Bacteroides fragilis str. 2-F-2 |nr:hypothetical protein M077_2893 [Bacteroides fragilis str. 2-F-2 \
MIHHRLHGFSQINNLYSSGIKQSVLICVICGEMQKPIASFSVFPLQPLR